MTARIRAGALATVVVLLAASAAVARPGGGESFSGGGGHGGGGGGGGASFVFELIWWLLRLVIYYPQIGLPVIAIVVGYILYSAYHQHQNKDWDSGPPVELARAIALDEVVRVDPEFSPIVFEDFAFRLFATAQRARATESSLATIAPYVGPAAREALATREPIGVAVEQVIVGALRVTRCDVPTSTTTADGAPARVAIELELEANVATAGHTYYSVERWRFARDATRHSKPPGDGRDFPCPNCGAPWQASATGTQVCASCNQVVDNGRFDWTVDAIALRSIDERPPTLTTEVPERGTDLPTYVDDALDTRWSALTAADPQVTRPAIDARLAMIYAALNTAWTAGKLAPVRGLVSDGLYDYLQYWVDAYHRQGLRNQLTDMRVTKTQLAKLTRDRYYDALTIRVWGTGKDFVVRTATGQLVRGSKSRDRAYSEYWTLIRSAARKAAPSAAAACGNCGAPLAVSMAGACEHCGAHVTGGEFDWVLSKIEQDDTYRG